MPLRQLEIATASFAGTELNAVGAISLVSITYRPFRPLDIRHCTLFYAPKFQPSRGQIFPPLSRSHRRHRAATVVRCEMRDLRCGGVRPTKSGGRQPAVRVGNTFAQTQAHLFGRPPTVYVRVAVALALSRYHGGLTPPLLCWCTDVCERQNDFCDVRTPIRNSGGRQPAVAR
jgi:hypothetical protein